MMKILKNKNELLAAIKQNDQLVVDFFAEWCQPCQMQGPILEKIAKKSSFCFCKVNIGSLDNVCLQQFNVVSIPTIIVFKKNKEVNRFVGLTDEATLLATLK